MRTKNVCAVLWLALAGVACESEQRSTDEKLAAERSLAREPTPPEATGAKQAELPPPKKLEGVALANQYLGCWAAFNARQWDKFGDCYAENATSRALDSGRPDLSGRQAIIDTGGKQFATAFTDGKGVPELVLVNGRDIASIALLTGTHDGPLANGSGNSIPATGKRFGQRQFHTATVNEENRATREALLQNWAAMMSQLGLSELSTRAAQLAASPGSPTVVVARNDATEKTNVELVEKLWENVQKEDLNALTAMLAEDVVEADQLAAEDLRGKKAVRDWAKTFLDAMGAIKVECPTMWGAGAYVVAQCKFAAKNDGDMGSQFKKTGKSVDLNIVEVVKISDGKLQEVWRFMNGMAFAEQLGLIPAGKSGAATAHAAAPKPEPAAPAPKDRPAAGRK